MKKYLAYALGETFLVVIGILIALAINSYYQDYQLRKQEHRYLEGLQKEFQTSRVKLLELIKVNDAIMEGTRNILNMFGGQDRDEPKFSKLLNYSLSFDLAFNPNNALLGEMINSGTLSTLSDPDLRVALTNWLSTIEDIEKQESTLDDQRQKVLGIFQSDKYSIRRILRDTGTTNQLNLADTSLELSNLPLLESAEFENNMLLFLVTSEATQQNHYMPLMEDLDELLVLIEGNLDK